MRSSPNNRIDAIMNALLDAHDDAQRLSRSSLHRMPEFFMAVRVADYFAENFKNFGYKLEAQVKRTFDGADLWHQDIEKLLDDPEVRSNGRFDLVLRTGKRGRPSHVLEFKRGARVEALLKDVRRLAKICEHAGEERLKTNYLVFTQRCQLSGDTEGNTDLSHEEPLDTDTLQQALDTFSNVTSRISFTQPMKPLLDRNDKPIDGGSFRVVIVEIKAIQ